MVVAGVALIAGLGGTASAAFAPSKGDTIIARHSLSGNRLKNHTVSGAQIKLSSLGKVPTALSADNAQHAISADASKHAFAADSATHATNADTATHATSADTANGLPALHWVNLTLINNWVDANTSPDARPPAVALDAQGIVHFRGQIACSVATCSSTFSTISSDLSPSQTVRVTANQYNDATGQINIGSDGSLNNYDDPDHTTALYTRTGLDGITYALG
jgi:hypothetical protein